MPLMSRKVLSILGILFIISFVALVVWSFLVKPKVEEGTAPSNAVKISFPLKNGLYQVVEAGPSALEGVHTTPIEKYALDIVNVFSKQESLWKTLFSLGNAGFGTPVFAPCHGQVTDLHDGEIDHDTRLFATRIPSNSNNVTIACNGFNIYMAHFKKDSIRVKLNQIVNTDTQIGEVGNSGYSSGPHLHIHAFLDKNGQLTPLPMILNGRYLGRGDFISN